MSQVTVRELSIEEWKKIESVYPYNVIGAPDIQHSRLVIGQVESGEIVAYWVLFETVHVEPLWIHPDHRNKVGLLRKMWNKVISILRESGTPFAFATVTPENMLNNATQAERLGFKELPGKMYYLIPEKAFRAKIEADEVRMAEAKNG